jgi:uncharacterized protein (DUF1697 family)
MGKKSSGPSGYVAFLRAVNVSNTNRIRMSDLKGLFLSLGFSGVETYLQSGNVIFTAASGNPEKLEKRIESTIRAGLGLQVGVLVRSSSDLDKMIKANPFVKTGLETEYLHVTMFKQTVDTTEVDDSTIRTGKKERYLITPGEAYLYCPDGYGRTKLNNSNWERWTGRNATTRSWKTILAVRELMG